MTEHEHFEPELAQAEKAERVDREPTPERATHPSPRIWIGSLADYNAGTLTGEWTDAAVPDEELIETAQRILARSEDPAAEEWAIFDHEGFGSWTPDMYEDLSRVAAVARGIREHGPAFAAWADLHDADYDMLASFADAYLGEYDSPEAWAEMMLDDLGAREEIDRALEEKVGDLARYVHLDTGAWAQDAWLSGDIAIVHKPGGGVWVFDGRL